MDVKRRDFLKGSALGVAGLALPACRRSQTSEIGSNESKPHRYIDETRCIGCGQCVPLCPMGAIHLGFEVSSIDPHECTECGTCLRSNVCPEDAIQEGKLSWPRILREAFSNPIAEHEAYPISIVLSGLFDDVHRCCQRTGARQHTYLHSLGFFGKTEGLPPEDELEIITMCGHGMIAAKRVRWLEEGIRAGEITPAEAAENAARPCLCGIVNRQRAAEVFQRLVEVS